MTNKKYKWAIVDEKGKILFKCRIKLTAINNLPTYKDITFNKVKVININEIGENETKKMSNL
jgi:hypothetical protein